jgi:uncharacterized C2H2 Zn-finger protein
LHDSYYSAVSVRVKPRGRYLATHSIQKSRGFTAPPPPPAPAPAPAPAAAAGAPGQQATEAQVMSKLDKEKLEVFEALGQKYLRLSGLSTVHVKKGDLVCSTCKKECSSTANLRRHVQKVHLGKGKYLCSYQNVCNKSFQSRVMQKAHERKEHEGRGFICDEEGCGKVFSTIKAYNQHERLHQGNPKVKCSFCNREFNLPKYKKEHEGGCDQNPDQLELKCKYCSRIFHQRKAFNRHMKKDH